MCCEILHSKAGQHKYFKQNYPNDVDKIFESIIFFPFLNQYVRKLHIHIPYNKTNFFIKIVSTKEFSTECSVLGVF